MTDIVLQLGQLALIIIASLWFNVVLRNDINDDYTKIQHDIPIDHAKEAIDRSRNLIPAALLYWIALLIGCNNPDFWYLMRLNGIVIGLMFFNYWLLFDG